MFPKVFDINFVENIPVLLLDLQDEYENLGHYDEFVSGARSGQYKEPLALKISRNKRTEINR